jgi:flagellar assembly protein FliH
LVLARKYLFDDLDFDLEEQRRLEAVEAAKLPQEPPAPTFTEEELAAARQVAFAQGRAAGLADAVNDQSAIVLGVVQGLQADIAHLMQAEQQRQLAFNEAALHLAGAMLRQLFPEMAAVNGLTEINAVIAAALRERSDDPRLVIRVADSALDHVQSQIDALAADAGYAGKLVLLAEAEFGPSDVRIEWAQGGVERNAAAILAQIDTAIEQAQQLNTQPIGEDPFSEPMNA